MRYVINTANHIDTYLFFMPIACMIWKHVIGYEPIAIFAGNESSWKKNDKQSFVIGETKKFAKVHFIPPSINKVKPSTIAQVSRLYASSIPWLNEDDYLIISDVDTFPIDADWLNSQDYGIDFHIWNGYVFKNQNRFAMCHLGGSVKVWREMMDIKPVGMTKVLKANLDKYRDGWRYDELLATEKILSWNGWPDRVQFVDDSYESGKPTPVIYRGDRNENIYPGTISGYVEAHVWRPGFFEHKWENNLAFLSHLCDQSDVEYVEKYREQYLSLYTE